MTTQQRRHDASAMRVQNALEKKRDLLRRRNEAMSMNIIITIDN